MDVKSGEVVMIRKEERTDETQAEEDIESAINLIGFGKLGIKIIILGALIDLNAGFASTNIALITPSAACDFDLSTSDRGFMSATPVLGMLIGSYFWGCYADLSGRKNSLVIMLFMQGIFEASSGLISNFWGYCILKFLTGFSLSGQILVIPTYVGEFHPTEIRQKVISIIRVAWPIGAVLQRVVAWAVLPLDISYTSAGFFFRSWNLLVLIYASLAPFLAVWTLTFPETPKFLAKTGQHAELAKTLDKLHSRNTGRSFQEYLETLTNHGLADFALSLEVRRNLKKNDLSKCEKAREICEDVWRKTLELFRPSFLRKTMNIVTLMFSLGSIYYSFALWFPELFNRFAQFEEKFPGESTWVCKIATRDISLNTSEVRAECPLDIPRNVYVNAMLISLTDLPTHIFVAVFVGKLGPKLLLVLITVGVLIVASGLFFVNSSTQTLTLFIIYDSFAGMAIGIVLNIVVDLYPTGVRTMASGLAQLMVQIGATFGNILIGYLLDHYCTVFMAIIIIQLIVCVICTLLLPGRQKLITQEQFEEVATSEK